MLLYKKMVNRHLDRGIFIEFAVNGYIGSLCNVVAEIHGKIGAFVVIKKYERGSVL